MINNRFVDYMVLLITVVFAFVILRFIVLHLDIAPELSDASYYIINTSTPQFVDNHLSLFGPVWYSLFGSLPVIANRLLHLILLFGTGALLGWRSAQLFQGSGSSIKHYIAAVLSGSALLFYYCWALFDPSYNSLVLLFFMSTVLSAFPFMQIQTPDRIISRTVFFSAALCFGASITFVAFVKITAAALMTVFFALLFIGLQMTGPHTLSQYKYLTFFLLKLIILSLIGALAPVILIWARLFNPTEVWTNIQNGYHTTGLMGGHQFTLLSLFEQYLNYLGGLQTAFIENPPLIILLAVPFGIHALWSRYPAFHRPMAWLSLAAVSLCTILLIPLSRTTDSSQLLNLFAMLRVAATCLAVGALLCHERTPPAQLLMLFTCIIFAPLLMSAGTNNAWMWQFSPYTGLSLGFMGVSLIFCPWPRQVLYIPAGIAITLLSFIGFYSAIENHPYRLGGHLSEAKVPFLYGTRQEPMRAPEALALSYLALNGIPPNEQSEPAPVFIDLTGRAPGIGHHLGLRPPKAAWILSGYSGSDAYFDFALANLSDKDLAQAWILQALPESGSYKGLSEGLFNEYLQRASSLSFPRDYVEIAEVPIAYIERRARLYKPKE